MPRAKISEFSTTAGDNTDIDGINIAEGCAPSGINDAIRELMAQLKDFQSGAAGDNITVVGTLAAKGTSASGADLKLYEDTDNGTNYVGFMAPASIASNVQWTLPSADGTANQVLSTDGSGVLSWASGGNVSTSANNAFTGANTFYNATGQTFGTATSSEDGIVVAGRAGGSSSYRVTITPTTLTANRTFTLPNISGTVALATAAQTFTGTNTFQAALTIFVAASTQDAIVIQPRSGGTSSYSASLTTATLSANRTVTIPNETFTIGFRNLPPVGTQTGSYTLGVNDVGKYVQVSTGGSITIPTSTFAEGDAITLYNNTTGTITITCSAPTAYIAGTNTVKTSMTLATRGVATILFYSATACVVSGNVT